MTKYNPINYFASLIPRQIHLCLYYSYLFAKFPNYVKLKEYQVCNSAVEFLNSISKKFYSN